MKKEIYITHVYNWYDLKAQSWSGALQTLEAIEEKEKEEMTDIFYRDIKAIEEAIKYINESINTSEEVKSYYKETFNNLFDIILSLDYERNTKKQIKEVMIELYYLFKKEI